MDWLFGWGKRKREAKRKRYEAFLGGLALPNRQLWLLMDYFPNKFWREEVKQAIQDADDQKLKTLIQNHVIPDASPEFMEAYRNIGRNSAWTHWTTLEERGLLTIKEVWDDVAIGYLDEHPIRELLTFYGEGHLLTVAPTGKGKGQAHVIPNTFAYEGSVVVLDLKGEVYRATAWNRRYKGEVFKWAPFDEQTDAFNPLDFVDGWEDADLLTDLMIIPSGFSDPFWDNSAKALVTSLITYVCKCYPEGSRSMSTVMHLLSPSAAELEDLIDGLRGSGIKNLIKQANNLEMMEDKQLSSVFLTARTHLKEWDSPQIARATDFTSDGFKPADFLEKLAEAESDPDFAGCGDLDSDDGGPILKKRGAARTFYIIIPPQRIGNYSTVIRVLLTVLMKQVMNAADRLEAERLYTRPPGKSLPKCPVLFMMDELPQLGYIPQLERAIGIARSGRIRFWLFVQNLAQLQKTYPQHATFMENCRAHMFFGLDSIETAEHVCGRLGTMKGLFGDNDPVLTPQELTTKEEFLNNQIVFLNGLPVLSRLRRFYETETFQGHLKNFREMLEKTPDREKMDGRYTSADDVPPQLVRYRQEASRLEEERQRQATERHQATQTAARQRNTPPAPNPEPQPKKQDFGVDDPPNF